jgi:tRNA(His) 5'-end guanylyltransferase
MSDNTPLGNRMKVYERTYERKVPRRSYTLLRLDGRAFHTYLKDTEKPFDRGFVRQMDVVAEALCREIQGARFAYTQSDEISLLLTDFDTLSSELWFGGRIDKITSISAAYASVVLDRLRMDPNLQPQFDCRVWSMTDPVEVANYFVWRQRDAVRNSIQMLGQHYFTQAQLHRKTTDQIQEMLFDNHGINWNDLDPGLKRGRVVAYPGQWPKDPTGLSNLDEAALANWQVYDAPHFVAEPDGWLSTVIPRLPTLWP